MTGIYKITSPSGKIYIGQSVNIKRRFSEHNYLKDKRASPLYSSFIKYGIEAHKFEVIHGLPNDVGQSVLDAYEVLYISQYKSCGYVLMNLDGGGMSRQKKKEVSLETRQKMSIALKGRKFSEEHRAKIAAASIGHKRNNGRVFTEEHKRKLSESNKGKHSHCGGWNKGLMFSIKNGTRADIII